MNQSPKQDYHRVVVYISKEEYKKLRIKLLQNGLTVSGWFREMTQNLLNSA